MKISKELLISMGVVCMSTGIAFANESIQAYAHPTLFGTQGHTLVTAQNDVIIGGRVYKPCHVKTIEGKQNVVIAHFAKQMLGDMQSMMDKRRSGVYDPKMPVLRSELAYLLSKSLELTTIKDNTYTDVDKAYWAKDEIDRALTADVMIGYPDSTFKPDKAITKAEVFCTFAKLMDINADKKAAPKLNGKQIKYVPQWAYGATNEVIASGLLKHVPNIDKVVNDEYLSKEQVAYFLAAMKKDFMIDLTNGAVNCAKKYEPVAINIKLSERISARTSNVGETFTAKTTKDVTIAGKSFPAGSTVKGVVKSVARPGVKKPGYVEVQFESIKNGDLCLDFPRHLSSAQVNVMKNPNIASRILGAPFSITGRVAGVAGRSISESAEIIANDTEEYLGDWSDAFCDTASLHPLKGLKSVGSSFVTVGKGVYDLSKLVVSGTFGVLYEFYDECKYVIVPNTTNDSCLNPDEELTIIY